MCWSHFISWPYTGGLPTSQAATGTVLTATAAPPWSYQHKLEPAAAAAAAVHEGDCKVHQGKQPAACAGHACAVRSCHTQLQHAGQGQTECACTSCIAAAVAAAAELAANPEAAAAAAAAVTPSTSGMAMVA